jgi:RNA polymerase sigma factor (sigma-70 family)
VDFTFETFSKNRTDQELWAGIRRSDESAFTTVFDLYHATLYNYGSKLCTNSAIVEDAVQDVFIDVWRLRHGLTENITSIKFYLYRALRRRIHVAIDKFPITEDIELINEDNTFITGANFETILIESESSAIRSRQIQELLSILPERQIEALTLRYFEDFSTEEIAQIMGVSDKSVRNFIYKALTTLRTYKQTLILSSLIFWLLLVF